MSIFRRPDYQSDTTRFLGQLRSQQSGLEAQQRAGRALLWDKQVDRAAWRAYRAAEVPQQPYVYQTSSQS